MFYEGWFCFEDVEIYVFLECEVKCEGVLIFFLKCLNRFEVF